MPDPDDPTDDLFEELPPKRRRWRRLGWVLLGLVIGIGIFGWMERRSIADNIIADELSKLGLEATYTVEDVGPERQVLTDIVIGDPRRPDLTIERAEVTIEPQFGFPAIGTITLLRPRVYGSYRDGELSFGALDPLLFGESEEPFELPDYTIEVVDARGLVESDFGDVGLKLEGGGHLRSGFSAQFAAVAPEAEFGDCNATRATMFGTLSVDAERPRFSGPLRLANLQCSGGLAVDEANVEIEARSDRLLSQFAGGYAVEVAEVASGEARLSSIAGDGDWSWRDGLLVADYDFETSSLASSLASLGVTAIEGAVRAENSFERIEVSAELSGSELRLGNDADGAMGSAITASEGTLAAPLLAKLRGALGRELGGSALAASATYRQTGAIGNLVVPSLRVTGRGGSRLLDVSRLQVVMRPDRAPQIAGNFLTGGRDMPRASGRIEQRGGNTLLNVTMAEYSAGDSSLALPRLRFEQSANGQIRFAGQVRADGPLPGGAVRGLEAPLSGSITPDGTLSLWNGCTDFAFSSLSYANLSLDRRRLTLCPPRGQAIVRNDARGLRIAAGAPSLALTGRLGGTQIAVDSGAVGFGYPGVLSARKLEVVLGPPDTAIRLDFTNFGAKFGREIAGQFDGSEIRIESIPHDMLDASGNWRYANGVLSVSDGSFRFEDRGEPDLYKPLFAQGATLTLRDNVITAEARMTEPRNSREVVRAEVLHSLNTGAGAVDLIVDGLLFDDNLQPDDLTRLALGVVANVDGTVTGRGRIEWAADGEVSSNGRFRTAGMDLAAPFGPAQGLSGEIVFSDLLNLTTAPGQTLQVASINPGIEVFDGVLTYQLRNGEILDIVGGQWPFLGGTLTLRPTTMTLGVEEVRRYTLEIEGMEAARFIEQMELGNLAATGTFDGVMPLIFVGSDGRIEGGELQSRPPGGNLSYIGELTYEDLGTMGNFAFQSLRSLNYREMDVGIDGPLTGELVTQVRIDGVSQGEGTKQNIITRQIAKLPLQFNINIRAPFYKLITSIRSMYDPAFVRDPRDLGLIDDDGRLPPRDAVTFEEAATREEELETETEPE